MEKEFRKLCTPAKIYFVLSILAIIISLFKGFHLMLVLMKLLFATAWTYVLYWLCEKGFKAISWFLVLLPFIMIFLMYLGLMTEIKLINKINPFTEGYRRGKAFSYMDELKRKALEDRQRQLEYEMSLQRY